MQLWFRRCAADERRRPTFVTWCHDEPIITPFQIPWKRRFLSQMDERINPAQHTQFLTRLNINNFRENNNLHAFVSSRVI